MTVAQDRRHLHIWRSLSNYLIGISWQETRLPPTFNLGGREWQESQDIAGEWAIHSRISVVGECRDIFDLEIIQTKKWTYPPCSSTLRKKSAWPPMQCSRMTDNYELWAPHRASWPQCLVSASCKWPEIRCDTSTLGKHQLIAFSPNLWRAYNKTVEGPSAVVPLHMYRDRRQDVALEVERN